MGDQLPFFGYGILADTLFLQELFGRNLTEDEGEAVIKGYELRVVPKEQIDSPSVQNDPEIPDSFKIYGITETHNNTNLVKGRFLFLNSDAIKLVRMLDFGTDVFRTDSVTTHGGIRFYSHVLKRPAIGPMIGVPVENGLRYNPYLNGGEEYARTLARVTREKAGLAPVQIEGQQPGHGTERR